MEGSVLVVDDEKLIRWSLKEYLQGEGFEVTAVEDGEGAVRAAQEGIFDVVLLDYRLPGIDGLEVLARLREQQPDLPVVMVTAHANVEHAVTALKSGAADYLAKPFRNEDVGHRVRKVLEAGRLQREVRRLRSEQSKRFGSDRIIGKSAAMHAVFKLIERVLPLADATILIQGESGTGKDVLARAIHYGGPRAEAPYVNITCTALPESLLESELFGHEKGSFTDAKLQKKGLVEEAHGGTLFLDEIGDMSLYLQSKLLRFLEEKTFRRVGGNKDIKVQLRVIAATNRDLKKLVDEGKFREDLYFRLKVVPIRLPPLREREGDILLLAQYFIDEYNREFKKSVTGISPDLAKRFESYGWPGNVRELKNTIERAMILGTQDILSADDIPVDLFDGAEARKVEPEGLIQLTREGVNLESLERDLICQALRLTHGNQTKAGRLLGLNRDQVRYRLEKFHLKICEDGDVEESEAEEE